MAHCTDTEADHGSELSDNDECRRRDVERSSTQHKAGSAAGTRCWITCLLVVIIDTADTPDTLDGSVCVMLWCPSVCLSVPSIDRCMLLQWVCCCGPGGQEISICCNYWHCSHSIWQGLCNGTVSIHLSVCQSLCPSVCLSHLSTAAYLCGGFAAVGLVGRRYRLIAAATGRHSTAATAAWCVTSKASNVTLSAHVGSWRQTCLLTKLCKTVSKHELLCARDFL